MIRQRFDIEDLNCLCCFTNNRRISYILYPMDILNEWVGPAAEHYNTSIVVLTGMDWDNDLTPWPAKGVPKGCPDFKGRAGEFLVKLGRVTAEIEKRAGLTGPDIERTLVGVSLSGLFTLWQWPQSCLFKNIACLSGSFWYDGFLEWFEDCDFSSKTGMAYFLLGDRETHTRVKVFESVGVNTRTIVDSLTADGIRTHYDIVPGDHYKNPIQRLTLAMRTLDEGFLECVSKRMLT